MNLSAGQVYFCQSANYLPSDSISVILKQVKEAKQKIRCKNTTGKNVYHDIFCFEILKNFKL